MKNIIVKACAVTRHYKIDNHHKILDFQDKLIQILLKQKIGYQQTR
jgi:hypothetical protein